MHLHFDSGFVGQAVFTHKANKTPCTIAALLYFTAIAVVDDIGEVCCFRSGPTNRKNLVCAHAEMAVRYEAVMGRGEAQQALGLVEHHKVIARTLHFCKSYAHRLIIALS